MTTRVSAQSANPLLVGLLAILALPFVEFTAFFLVAGAIGFLPALLALVATSFIGAALLRRQGRDVLARLSASLGGGVSPHGAARDGFLVALGGLLMIIPGFVTDVIGFGLMLPSLVRSLDRREAVQVRPRDRNARVVDLSADEWHTVDDRSPKP